MIHLHKLGQKTVSITLQTVSGRAFSVVKSCDRLQIRRELVTYNKTTNSFLLASILTNPFVECVAPRQIRNREQGVCKEWGVKENYEQRLLNGTPL